MRAHLAAQTLFLSGALAVVGPAGAAGAETLPAGVAAQIVEGSDASHWGYAPLIANVSAGQSLTWINSGQAPHTVTEDGGSWDTGILLPGATASLTFATPGSYTYHCTLHLWMKGTLLVTSAAPTGDAAPPEMLPTVPDGGPPV